MEEEGSEVIAALAEAAKRGKDKAQRTYELGQEFSTKLQAALAGAKIQKTALEAYIAKK